jgi:hypothetical protein
MVKNEPKKQFSGRSLALTILIGVFISAMVITFVNLTVSYIYESPEYDKICNVTINEGLAKAIPGSCTNANCTFNKELSDQADSCIISRGNPVFEYNNQGCAIAVNECNRCSVEFEELTQEYNRNVFFIFAVIGFILIVAGLFSTELLLQIIFLPSGAFLVIESAVRNINDKLYVIIVFALLIIAATYLAWKKLKSQ